MAVRICLNRYKLPEIFYASCPFYGKQPIQKPAPYTKAFEESAQRVLTLNKLISMPLKSL